MNPKDKKLLLDWKREIQSKLKRGYTSEMDYQNLSFINEELKKGTPSKGVLKLTNQEKKCLNH